jgi:hypothetical protein
LSGRWTRAFVALCVLVGLLSIGFILDFTQYPYAPHRRAVAQYLLRTQDITGAALLIAIVLTAAFAPYRDYALHFVERVGRHPWRAAGVAFVVLCLGALFVEHNHPLAQDEYAALFQSRIFAAGRLTAHFPAQLIERLVPEIYLNQFIYGSYRSGEVASAYWPGFALLLTPFSLLGVSWVCNPLLAALSLVVLAKMATRLSGTPQAAGWAIVLTVASPAFTGMAISYFSMTAHLLANLLFAWLLMERTLARVALAGVVGSFALVLHNPLPHMLFAAPWIVWLGLQPQRWRHLAALAAGYAPLVMLLGFGWALLLSGVQGKVPWGYFASEDDPLHRMANFLWSWHIRMRSVVEWPGSYVLNARLAELLRLWNWAVPGLAAIAAAGWWLGRRDRRLLLLGLSVITTLLGYAFIVFDQGHGWGARYLHPAWGALPLLASVALTADSRASLELRRLVAAAAVLSLVLATALRAWQIEAYLSTHLSQLPPHDPDERQVVLIRYDRVNYTADLVQNDPFLRNKTWYLMSFGKKRDAELMARLFPGARLVHEDTRGEVWRLD